ncbi:MAG: DUF2520 domain-containing protein [Calditrichaeota bacterium]|nr:DUF2520 domain-containing protein [Calditrichota bacterium]
MDNLQPASNGIIPKIAIVGYGRLGKALARALSEVEDVLLAGIVAHKLDNVERNGYRGFSSIGELPTDIGMVILAVPDSSLAGCGVDVSNWIAAKQQRVVAAHTAGAVSSEVLEPVRAAGGYALAWHPFQTFTGREGWESFQGITVGLEGDDEAVVMGMALAVRLGAKAAIVPPETRVFYHLAAVFGSSLMVALLEVAVDLLDRGGFTRAEALKTLRPLVDKTLANYHERGFFGALTGPVVRSDAATVARHLQALDDFPNLERIYSLLSRELLKRLPPDRRFDELATLLTKTPDR